jgi:hypothetical protein
MGMPPGMRPGMPPPGGPMGMHPGVSETACSCGACGLARLCCLRVLACVGGATLTVAALLLSRLTTRA